MSHVLLFAAALLSPSDQFPCILIRVRILYGGSLKPENAAEILTQPDVDGGLGGGRPASLKPT